MSNAFSDAGTFLIQMVLDLYIFIVMLKVIMQWVGADYYSPLSQFVVKATNPLLLPLRRVIPFYKSLDIAALLLALVLGMLKLVAIAWLQIGIFPNFLGLVLWSLGGLINQLLDIFFYAILIVVILNWVNPMAHNAFVDLLHRIAETLLQPIRRMLPTMGGMDLSPLVALFFLKVSSILLAQPLLKMGAKLIATAMGLGQLS